jgi:hypothetical protein
MTVETAGARALIERAGSETPYCLFCGAPTSAVADERDAIWLECRLRSRPRSRLRRLLNLSFLSGHTRRLIVRAPRA